MPPVTQARLCRSGFEGDRRRQVPGRARLPKAGADGAQTPQLRPGDVTVMGEHSVLWVVPAPHASQDGSRSRSIYSTPTPAHRSQVLPTRGGSSPHTLAQPTGPPLLQGSRTNCLSSSRQSIAHLMAAMRAASANTSVFSGLNISSLSNHPAGSYLQAPAPACFP